MMKIITAFLLLINSVVAEKDSSYYPSGYSNPNVDEKMYWKDSANVLEDLGKFSKLYVSFEKCAIACNSWSPYGGEDEENACEIAEADDESYWYLGYTECFRANAAYSLYGVLKGEEDEGCNKRSFINSFLTTQGVEAFTQAIQAAGITFTDANNNDENANDNGYPGGVTSSCYYKEVDNGGDDQNVQQVSYGLGCSGKSFVEKTYRGAYCSGQNAVKTTDQLSNFNKYLSDATCVPIYQKNNNNDGDGDADPLDVLYYSKSCDIREFPKQCPDPYGKLKAYAAANERAVAKSNHPWRERLKTAFSWIFLIIGLACIAYSIFFWCAMQRRKEAREKMTQGNRDNGRRSSRGSNSSEKASTNKKSSKSTKSDKKPGFFKRIGSRLLCKTDKEARNYN